MSPGNNGPSKHQDRDPNMRTKTLDDRTCDKSDQCKHDSVQERTSIDTGDAEA
jgi:hypothetical protein